MAGGGGGGGRLAACLQKGSREGFKRDLNALRLDASANYKVLGLEWWIMGFKVVVLGNGGYDAYKRP